MYLSILCFQYKIVQMQKQISTYFQNAVYPDLGFLTFDSRN